MESRWLYFHCATLKRFANNWLYPKEIEEIIDSIPGYMGREIMKVLIAHVSVDILMPLRGGFLTMPFL